MEFSNKEAIRFRFLEQKNFEDCSYNFVFLLVLEYRVSVTIQRDGDLDRDSEAFVVKGVLNGTYQCCSQIKYCPSAGISHHENIRM